MRFRAVIFDLFGTLAPPFPASFDQSLESIANAVGIAPQDLAHLWREETAYARVTGLFASIEENLRYVCEAADVTPTEAQLAQAMRIRLTLTWESLCPRPDAVATLQHLKAAGLRLGLISNCSPDVPQLWPQTPFAALIDVPVFSCTAGCKKPDPRIYRLACDGLGVEPGQCLYVGDGFSRELAGASSLGMQAVLIAPPGEVRTDKSPNESDLWTGARIECLSDLVTMIKESHQSRPDTRISHGLHGLASIPAYLNSKSPRTDSKYVSSQYFAVTAF